MKTRFVAVLIAALAFYAAVPAADDAGGTGALNVNRIVPVLGNAADAREIATAGHGKRRPEIYFEPLNRQLNVYYAVETERSVRYLSREEVLSLGLGSAELGARAVDNLTRRLPGIERRGDAGTYMVTAGGTYEASLLLFETLWTKENFEVDGDIVVAVPSRELLLVTGSGDERGLKTLRRLAAAAAAHERHALTARLFVRRNGAWLPFDGRP